MAFAACLAAAPVRAHTANLAGSGVLLCSELLARLDEPLTRTAFAQWALGFMSGANMAMGENVETYRELYGINSDVVIGTLRSHCAETPTEPIRMAVQRLFSTREARHWPKPR